MLASHHIIIDSPSFTKLANLCSLLNSKGCLSVSCNCSSADLHGSIYVCAQDNCRLTYNATGSVGFYAVAIQVEDFITPSSTLAMSSVPVQFLVHVQQITHPPNVTAPTFVGTAPMNVSCIQVGSTYQQQIIARSGGQNIT